MTTSRRPIRARIGQRPSGFGPDVRGVPALEEAEYSLPPYLLGALEQFFVHVVERLHFLEQLHVLIFPFEVL